MMHDISSILQHVCTIVHAVLGDRLQRLFLFGSRAKKRNLNPHADIDIGCVADHPLSITEIAAIRDGLETIPTLLKIDLVDFTQRSDPFSREAHSTIEVLYEKNGTT